MANGVRVRSVRLKISIMLWRGMRFKFICSFSGRSSGEGLSPRIGEDIVCRYETQEVKPLGSSDSDDGRTSEVMGWWSEFMFSRVRVEPMNKAPESSGAVCMMMARLTQVN